MEIYLEIERKKEFVLLADSISDIDDFDDEEDQYDQEDQDEELKLAEDTTAAVEADKA